MDAIRSRGFVHVIDVTVESAKVLLLEASKDKTVFTNVETAELVARYICERVNEQNLPLVNYRTLKKSVELATHAPRHWEELVSK